MTHTRFKVVTVILDNSLPFAGTVVAVVWANVDWPSYDALAHPLHFWVNDVGMVFFFALAAKEVFEATLPGGHVAFSAMLARPGAFSWAALYGRLSSGARARADHSLHATQRR